MGAPGGWEYPSPGIDRDRVRSERGSGRRDLGVCDGGCGYVDPDGNRLALGAGAAVLRAGRRVHRAPDDGGLGQKHYLRQWCQLPVLRAGGVVPVVVGQDRVLLWLSCAMMILSGSGSQYNTDQ